MPIKLEQFSNKQTYFMSDDKGYDKGYHEGVYEIPLTCKMLSDANMVKFYWAEIEDEGRARFRTPEMTIEEAVPLLYAQAALNNAVESFERRVFYPRLQEQLSKATMKGLTSTVGDIEICSWSMCGRVIFTMRRGDVEVSLITAEDEEPYGKYRADILRHEKMGPMGIQSINATANQACDLIFELIARRDEIQLVHDKDVNLMY